MQPVLGRKWRTHLESSERSEKGGWPWAIIMEVHETRAPLKFADQP